MSTAGMGRRGEAMTTRRPADSAAHPARGFRDLAKLAEPPRDRADGAVAVDGPAAVTKRLSVGRVTRW